MGRSRSLRPYNAKRGKSQCVNDRFYQNFQSYSLPKHSSHLISTVYVTQTLKSTFCIYYHYQLLLLLSLETTVKNQII